MVRKVVQRGLYPILALMMTGFFFVPVTFGAGKSAEQRTFATVQDAAEALGTAYGKGDRKAVAVIPGDKALGLVSSGDPVIDRHECAGFLSLYRQGHEVLAETDSRAVPPAWPGRGTVSDSDRQKGRAVALRPERRA
jgi:hypothetical protein